MTTNSLPLRDSDLDLLVKVVEYGQVLNLSSNVLSHAESQRLFDLYDLLVAAQEKRAVRKQGSFSNSALGRFLRNWR